MTAVLATPAAPLRERLATPATISFTLYRLHPLLGAEVEGLDIAADLTQHSLRALRAALATHLVLVLRDQAITPERQLAFTAALGPIARHPLRALTHAGAPEIVVELAGADDRDVDWHADLAWSAAPNRISAVAAAGLQDGAWTSEFASQAAAYDALDPWLRDRIEFLEVEHDHPRREAAGLTPARHPLVRVDPETGRRALLLDEGSARRVCGLPEEEGAALLHRLRGIATRPGAVLRHAWREGDLVVWDNLSVLHRTRRAVAGRLHRTMVGGSAPIGPRDVAMPWVSAG